MKKFEIVLGIMFMVGLTMRLTNLPGGGLFLGVSLILLSLIYLLFSYFIFLPKSVPGSENGKNKVFTIILILIFGWIFSAGLLGILIRIQSYFVDSKLLENALILLFPLLVFTAFLFYKHKLLIYKHVLIRGVIIFGFGLISYVIF
jgi:hypothetical protein